MLPPTLVDLPKVEVLVPVPRVRAGLLPNSPVPKDGALVVVVPNPAVLFPNKLGCLNPPSSKINPSIYNMVINKRFFTRSISGRSVSCSFYDAQQLQ